MNYSKVCRCCLSPSNCFISVFGKFQGRSVCKIIENLTQIKVEKNPKISKFLCEKCLTSFLNAQSIIDVFKNNNKFLNELAECEEEIEEAEEDPAIVEVAYEELK